MSFEIGDKVRWSSTSNGSAKQKEGVIVFCLPPGMRPMQWPNQILHDEIKKALDSEGISYTTKFLAGGGSREEKSYLVAVSGKTPRTQKKLYWPRVEWMEKVD